MTVLLSKSLQRNKYYLTEDGTPLMFEKAVETPTGVEIHAWDLQSSETGVFSDEGVLIRSYFQDETQSRAENWGGAGSWKLTTKRAADNWWDIAFWGGQGIYDDAVKETP